MGIGQIISIGFLMGLLGSAHCIGMCGPLVMALPLAQKTSLQKTLSVFLYHIGKMSSYAVLGIVVGLFGRQLFIADVQQHISIIIGSMMLIYVIWVFMIQPKTSVGSLNLLQKPLLKWLGELLKSKFVGAFLVIGFLNGLLPCGMVYLALTSAMATGKVFNASMFMLFFGLGTVPALVMVALGGQYMGHLLRRKIQQMLPFFIFTMGVFLILRGMSLGIPFVSPQLGVDTITCHN